MAGKGAGAGDGHPLYVIALSGVIESWVLDELDYTPEELISFADTLLNDHICGILMRLGGGQLHI